MTSQLERQIRLSRMLSMGFVFTISPAWMFSCASVFIGVWAMFIINESTEPMAGRVIAWWCIIVGSLQNLVALLYLVQSILIEVNYL
ncbi:MAG TPA: hypothetical protein VFY40_17920 [Blastocatellia bacterium]|nr:hypothetical protein [Blastocatellia bacterium]